MIARLPLVSIFFLFFSLIHLNPSAAALIYYQSQGPYNNPAIQQQPAQELPLAPLQSQVPQSQQLGQDLGQPTPNQELASHRGQERDGPIFRYQGIALNSTTIKLIWNLRNGYHADYFDIQWGPIPDATHVFSVSKLNGTARDYTFHQLQPDTLYQFQLHGYNGDHIFKPQLVAVRTPPVGKSQQETNRDIMPLGVKAESKSNNSIQLSWTEPERPSYVRNSVRVNIIRYYINPSLAPSAGQAGNESTATPQYHYLNITNARESRLIVQKLKPATEYAFAVKTAYYTPDMKRLYTQSGFSMDTLAKTFDIEPSAPKNFNIQPLATSKEDSASGQGGKLELSWLPPDSTNGQLRGYVILYAHEQSAPEEQWIRIDVNGAHINNWYVANLRPGASYYFKIRAINQRGQSPDSETRLYVAPGMAPSDKMINIPIPTNNILLLIVICMVAILFVLFLIVSKLACKTGRKPRKGSLNAQNQKSQQNSQSAMPKLNGFASTNSSSAVTARVGTLARRRDNNQAKPDFWISAMDQQLEAKTNVSEKSNSELNMAMVSIQRDSPQFATTQLAPALPDYRLAPNQTAQNDHLMQQYQHHSQGHYHSGQFGGPLAYDQMDNATASALMTLSKRQQQQMQKYQIQFASAVSPPASLGNNGGQQAPSPHQQPPPPPPPLNIEQQQQQLQHQSLYGTHQPLANTRSLRVHRPTLYDPVSGSFVQSADNGPPNYSSHTAHHVHPTTLLNNPQFNTSSTLQFHPHQTSTLLSRRSTNTLRSFQNSANATYGLLGNQSGGTNQFGAPTVGANQQPQLLQSHQAVINQLNNSTYPSLPLKHVSAVRPQIMSSLEDQIEIELAEKEKQHQQSDLQQNIQNQNQQHQPPIKQ